MDTEVVKSIDTTEQSVNDNVEVENQQDSTESVSDVWSEDFDVNDENSSSGSQEAEAQQTENIDWDAKYQEQRTEKADTKLPEPILVKYKGKILDIDTVGELRDLAERGISATQKLQEIAEERKALGGITNDDIELLNRLKSGDTSVVEELAKPKDDVVQNEAIKAVDTIAGEILQSPYSDSFKSMVTILPQADKTRLSSDPQLLSALKKDFDDGVAQKLMPLLERNIAVKGMPFIEAYKQAGIDVFSGSQRRKTADKLTSQPKATSSIKDEPQEDIWSMDSDKFNALMSRGR